MRAHCHAPLIETVAWQVAVVNIMADPEHAQTLTTFLAVVLKLLWHFHLNFAV